MALIHEELTAKILEAAFEVSSELGSGFLESVYQKALLVALHDKGLKALSQVQLDVEFRGVVVGSFYADLLVESKVLIELKAVQALLPEHQAQVINYLKATRIQTGLLLDFGKPRLEYRRLYG